MSHVGTHGADTFLRDPAHTRFVCDVLSDHAADGKFAKRKAYQVLRVLSAIELWELYVVWKDQGAAAFRQAFGPVYYTKRGENEGPLFSPGAVDAEG